MKRQCAFTGNGRMLKGGLHCHTTRSDGRGTPEEVLKKHLDNGYDFLAVTDHRFYNYSNFGLPITVVPGMEMDANFADTANTRCVHCHHIVCVGPERDRGNGFAQDQRFDSVRISQPQETQPMLDMLHENGNLTVYCHPEWSGTPAREFDMLRGNFAMEIWNSGCAVEDGLDTDNGWLWDDLLSRGQVIYGVATDDGHAMDQHCLGWVTVNAENRVSSILDALASGAFYSSCGPEIYDFRVEDGRAFVECSPVSTIQFRQFNVPYHMVRGEGVTRGETALRRSCGAQYVRAVVTDSLGRRAWTNPIFLDDGDLPNG